MNETNEHCDPTVFINTDGTLISVGDPPEELSLMGEARRRRASSITPLSPVKYLAFLVLRALFGERGRIAAWTRTWKGPWVAVIKETRQCKVHQSRQVLLRWERSILEEQLTSKANLEVV